MIVLGISDSSVCGGATIAVGDKVIASINEERLDRQKLSTGFPAKAIQAVLDIARIKIEQLDRVHVADHHNYFKPQSSYWEGWLIDHPSKRKEMMATLSSAVASVVGNYDFAQTAYYALKKQLTKKRKELLYALLQEQFGVRIKPLHVDHHFCHATSAYYTAGFDECVVITLDGGGDGLCSRVYTAKHGQMKLIHSLRSYHSIGNYYAYITKLCGFTAHKHEGKVTGLAAFGKPLYRDILAKMIRFDGTDFRNTGNAYYWSAMKKIKKALPRDCRIEDLAASIQKLLEESAVAYCEHWIKQSGLSNVALAGGVFANVRLNQEIHALDCVDKIFIHPGMGDEGLSFGAAMTPGTVSAEAHKIPLKDVYLGPRYSEQEIERALIKRNMAYQRKETIETDVAELLAKGYVVARFDGRMEYGPRALGNRSILYQPNDRTANDWLNKHLHRTEFMPFAPAVAMENESRCFKGVSGAENAARFMTITFECTDEMAQRCCGVTHVDKTARPQLVREDDNPSYYKIIREYERLTGLPCIVNTSFNVHDEPIVCSPDDALNGFIDGDLDYLAIGNFLIEGGNAQTRQRVTTSSRTF